VRDRSVYEFGDVRVDLGRMAALRGGVAIPLEPKAFDVLVHLIEHRDRLVTKEELLDAVWTGTFVTPNVLSRAVAQVRKGLGDESQDARFIETIAKRGYRFIAPVTVIQPVTAPDPEPALPAMPAAIAARAAGAGLPAAEAGRRTWVVPLLAVLAVAVIAVVIFAFRARSQPDAPATDLQLKRLTNRRGYTGTPALAPDGRAIVYASDVSGSLELYLTSLAPGSAELPLTKDGGHNVQPTWSPDGQWIAFHSRKRSGVWIVPSSGGTPQQVADFGSDPAWSPDSATLVFTSDAGGLAGQSSLWTVRRDGTGRRALTKIGAPAGGHRAPAWSHDGRHVVFVVTRGGWRVDVWTVHVASGATQLIDTSTNAADPCFAPGDRAILWGGSTPAGNARLFKRAIDADGKPVGTTDVVLPMDGGIVEGLSIAANGTLALAARTLDANLWATDVGADGRGSEPRRLTDDVSRNTHPDSSRDRRIVYMQTAIGSGSTVWMMRDDGTGREPLVAEPGAGNPHWDADGRRVLVGRWTPGNVPELVWVDLASRRVTPSGVSMKDMATPRLSPDGKALAFHVIEKDGVMSVWTARFDGTRRKVAIDPEAVSYPAWSPDGRSLAVEIKRGDSTQIGVVASAGGPVELLTNERGQSWPHSWAPDNDRIAFAGQRGGVWNIYTVSRRTRAVTQVTFFTSSAGYVRYPSWSPSGSRVVFERAVESGNVWTVTLPADR
jgi:Tol biopolymer transport system component/DNA-binding winged helix-turn-helix (wHTH) protein